MTDHRPRRLITRELVWYFVAAYAFSWILWVPPLLGSLGIIDLSPLDVDRFRTGKFDLTFTMTFLGAFGPILSAVAVTWAFRRWAGVRRLLGSIFIVRVNPIWYLAAIVVPVIFQLGGRALRPLITGEQLPPLPPMPRLLAMWATGFVMLTIFIVVEELGWRGFAMPRLQAGRSALWASVIVGVLWAWWHIPYQFTLNYQATGSAGRAAFSVLTAPIFACLLSILMAWIFNSSRGSVLLMMIMHGSNNAAMGIVIRSGGASSMLGGAGMYLILLVMVGLVLWRYGANNLSASERVTVEE